MSGIQDTLCAFMFGGPEHMESWECGFVKDHPIHAEGGKEFRHSFVKPKPTVATEGAVNVCCAGCHAMVPYDKMLCWESRLLCPSCYRSK